MTPRSDPTERRIAEAGKAIGAWYRADAGRILAALLGDEAGPDGRTARTLVFGSGPRRLEVRVSGSGVEGRLDPPAPGRVWLLDGTGPVAEATADASGSFRFPDRRRGPFRIECPAGDGRWLATEWITV